MCVSIYQTLEIQQELSAYVVSGSNETMVESISTLKKRKRGEPGRVVSVRCLRCNRTYENALLYENEKNDFWRVSCAGLTRHIQNLKKQARCFHYYSRLNKVLLKDRKYHFALESSIVSDDAPTANEDDQNLLSDYVYHPEDLGILHQNVALGFNRSINNQTIAIPSQNIESSLLETLHISNEVKGGNDEVENSLSVLFRYGDRHGSESASEESETEAEDAAPAIIPTTSFTSSKDVEIPTIDSKIEEFRKNISDSQLLAEIDLMNIMTQHKMPLTAFKTIFDWAKRSQGRQGFDFDGNCTETRGRPKILSEIRRISRDKTVDEFKPKLVPNWLPLKKETKVYVREFQTALKSLLTNKSLVKEENLSFPDATVPFIWEEFPDPWEDNKRVIKEL